MASLVSSPIAIADATATTFDLLVGAAKVNIGVIFYSHANGASANVVAAGSGTRDIAVSKAVPNDTTAGTVNMSVVGAASVSANPAWSLKTFDLGVPTHRIVVACAAASNPNGATHYRIFVDY
jgi:hypothetical protein